MDAVPVWVVLVVLGVIGALAALLWGGSDRQHQKHAERLDDHDKDIATLKTEVANLKHEVTTLRDRWHELVDSVTQNIAQWANKMMEWWRDRK